MRLCQAQAVPDVVLLNGTAREHSRRDSLCSAVGGGGRRVNDERRPKLGLVLAINDRRRRRLHRLPLTVEALNLTCQSRQARRDRERTPS